MSFRFGGPDEGAALGPIRTKRPYDVFAQSWNWDEVTRRMLYRRLRAPESLRFFTEDEADCLHALLARLTGLRERNLPMAHILDGYFADELADGWRYEDMPHDGEAWKRSIAALDEECFENYGRRFPELDIPTQTHLLEAIRQSEEWRGFPSAKLWSVWIRYATRVLYSHPASWSIIGFGGPAYPRGYKNLGIGKREHWESPVPHSHDPIPWALHVEEVRKRHAERVVIGDRDPSKGPAARTKRERDQAREREPSPEDEMGPT